jgi:Lrp/AsnC family transcriptional regulator, leucine-responsive regulatory protein
VDSLDHAILFQLQSSGRISNVELADRVGLSPSPCLRRVRHLEAAGVITGYQAVIDPAAVGRGFQVIVHANMMVKDRSTIEAFEAEVVRLEEVIECRRMFGDPDYLLWVAVADVDAYERFYMSKLADLPGVARMNSQFTMKTIKPDGRLRIQPLLPR